MDASTPMCPRDTEKPDRDESPSRARGKVLAENGKTAKDTIADESGGTVGTTADQGEQPSERAGASLGAPAAVSETAKVSVDSAEDVVRPSAAGSDEALDASLPAEDDTEAQEVLEGEIVAPEAAQGLPDDDVDYSQLDVPGADRSDNVEPVVIESTPEEVVEAVAFFDRAKGEETQEQKKRASGTSRVFSVMQYRAHPKTGEVMLTQEQIDEGLEKLHGRLHKWAYVWHDADRLVEVDEGTGETVCVGLKGAHVHMVLWVTDSARSTIRTVSDALKVPSARVKTPREAVGDGEGHSGRGAAEKSFFDLCEYLPHESRRADAIAGVYQTERSYLVDKHQDGKPGKYQYGRGRVMANFAFGQELDAHMATRRSAAEGTRSLGARKRKLRRLVGDGTMTLEEAKAADVDAFWDDLPRLQAVHHEYQVQRSDSAAAGLGKEWSKSTALILGEKGAGKGVLVDETQRQYQRLAALGGMVCSYVQPPGRNALEAVGGAEIVHHDDARYEMVPGYDEGLRYLDNHRATEPYQRHTRSRQVVAPRVIMMSSTETATSLGLTMKARRSSDVLALNERDSARRYAPVDIDEYLRRIGWVVEVSIPDDVELTGDGRRDYPVIREQMLVSVQRPRMGGDRRVEPVTSRSGEQLGRITTTHEMEPVAVVRGVESAARFLAVSMLLEGSPDVVARIPETEIASYLAQKAAVEAAAAEEQERARRATEEAAEREREERAEHERQARMRRLEEERERDLCTCGADVRNWATPHADACAALSDAEREKRRETARKTLDEKAQRLRANGFLLK
ncbi:hypothetical protein DEU31_0170 [Brachybacterium sp. AG952]|uniref:RNA helicase n=1 Tax=Brachybacterium sp. AG952 TaxID=2183989 RepID=UPI00105D085C|nr:RNA helicase [Brachybacterium sp. AG952]TDP79758.1 hypothetical protein DEU31_0170 [Brachybacterium sp. AG952]